MVSTIFVVGGRALRISSDRDDRMGAILGDPGADTGGEGKSKQAGKYGTKEK